MELVKFFINRPIFAIVLSIFVFVLGLISLSKLPVSEYPEVIPPSVVVQATFPGANPKEIATSVALPLEEAINGVEDSTYMKSIASSDGNLRLVVTFKQGVDPDAAAVRVQNRVSQALPRLPESVRQYGVTTQKQPATPLMFLSLRSQDPGYNPTYLRNYIKLHIKDELARIEGISSVHAYGAGDYAMRIWLQPDKLATLGLTSSDVISAVREQNIQVSAGQLGSEPSPIAADFLISINVDGRLKDEQEFKDIILKEGDNQQIVRLGDVARIELGADDYSMRTSVNGSDVVFMGVFLTPEANTLDTASAVYAKMDELSANFPSGVSYRAEWDPTSFIRDSIKAVQHTLIEAVVLVVLVVILFLQTWRASIIPLLAVPVSIVGTFTFLYLFGYSINTLTLFGMVLAIGIVVDDAIVVVESVKRHIENGLEPLEASHQAMREVSGPIVAIALVLCAVFVPMAFLSGVAGQFYKQFAVTIAISTVISAVNSLTMSPALAAILLKKHAAPKDVLERGVSRAFSWIFRPFNRFFKQNSERYKRGVAACLNRRGSIFSVYLLLLVVTGLLFHTIPSGFIPTQDKLYLFSGAQLPAGASLNRTDAIEAQMAEIARGVEGVERVASLIGLNALQFVTTPNFFSSYIILKPFDQRTRSAAEINAELSQKLSTIKDGFAYSLMPPPIQGLGNGSGYSLYLEDRGNLGYAVLQQAMNAFQYAVATTPGMVYPVSAYQSNIPQLEVQVDRVKVKAQGVKLTDLFDTLQTYLGSVYINDFNIYGRVYRVMAQADADYRQQIENIGKLHTRNANGEMVPIGSMITVVQSYGPDPVIRYNGYPAADLIGDADPRVLSSSEVIVKLKQIAEQVLPPGITLEWTDLSYEQVHQKNGTLIVFPIAILLAFFVLAALYESWTLPFAVLLIVPMSMFAALSGVWLTGGDNNIFVQVGLVVLMGLATKNAILIVEFARELEMQGKQLIDAILEACYLRLRPIVMTSIAFIMGSLPLLFSSGAGSEVRFITGVAVVFGMLGVTLFGLFLTPVFYVAIRKIVSRKQSTPQVYINTNEHHIE
ncbi:MULTISPECIES: efflux RND transporter permease subunit [unclassified Serratia (in: enterobacteria)]|uniref:efflux RND transporter permease subunit n=1 Tax=unclassified Serratia (in: enterobacteria) TaxID=2647522 RepID=UPI0030761EAB